MNLRAISRPALSHLLFALSVGGAALSVGCTDTKGRLDDFSERYDKIFANKPPTACPDAYIPLASGQADGNYLLVLSAPQKPDEPILFFAQVTTPTVDGSVGIGMIVTPVAKADRQTVTGDPQSFEAVPLDDSGMFEIEMPKLFVPKDANTIISLDVTANIVVMGNVCGDASFICGDVTGATESPKANLEGSTFTMMRIEDGKPFPDPVLDCEGTAAKPL